MKKLLSIVIFLMMTLGITQGQNFVTTTSTNPIINDTVHLCLGQTLNLNATVEHVDLFDFENGLPVGWTCSTATTFTTDTCGNASSNTVAKLQSWLQYTQLDTVTQIEWKMKYSDSINGCIRFNNSAYGGLQCHTSTGIMQILYYHANDTSYTWHNYKVLTTVPVKYFGFYLTYGNPGASIFIDDVKLTYKLTPDSVKWYCIETPSFYSNNTNTSDIENIPGIFHYVITAYKNGSEFSDTLIVYVDPTNMMVSSGILGNTLVCNNTLELYTASISNATSYIWTLPSGTTGNSIDSIININYNSTFANGNIIVKGINSCSSITDSITIVKRPLENTPICYVEYNLTTSKNKIVWTSIPNNLIDSIYIYREISSVFTKIGSASYNDTSYIDMLSNPPAQSYNYKISATNICNREGSKSSNHKTISLAPIQSGGVYYFSWTKYEGLFFTDYTVYGVDAANVSHAIVSVSNNIYNYNYISPDPMYVRYYVGIAINSCDGTKTTLTIKSNYVSTFVGISENQLTYFNIYPNPVSNELTIETPGIIKFEIFNNIGQLINSGTLTGNTIIDTENYLSGIYLIKLENGSSKRFIKK